MFLNLHVHICGIIWIVLISITLERARIKNQTQENRNQYCKVTMLKEIEAIHYHHLCQLTQRATQE